MMTDSSRKVTAEHLKRIAYLYVRQSSLKQVVENTESRRRQYDLRQRALALGWSENNIVVIDSDLGQSAASAADRAGFQQLVTEVGMGRAGMVMGLEVSRLARNSTDWHRLLEICAWMHTLILDEDGLYDPTVFNDRLLLGLKGTMSEAELYQLRARLMGGMLNKARRGELKLRLPVGFVYAPDDRIALNPDRQVQESIDLLFETFRRVGSAHRTVSYFRDQGLKFPLRLHSGPRKGEIVWRGLSRSRVMEVLHNPCYAGAYCYGRRKQRRMDLEGHTHVWHAPREEWHTLLVGSHEGYITWEEFEKNQEVLLINARGLGHAQYAPREGPALLQGLAVCAVCGKRMTVRYHRRADCNDPYYVCQGERNTWSLPACQSISGGGIDKAIGTLLLELVTPFTLEVALAVQQEMQARIEEADRLRHQQVERAGYEAELARRRYMQVDPDNRLVASSLESEWNNKLRELTRCREEYEQARSADRLLVDDRVRSQVLQLAQDFPKLWQDPKTPDRERKRMVRLMIEDVTLIKGDSIGVHIRFKGGATKSLQVPRALSSYEERRTSPEVVAEIDRLIDEHIDGEIAEILNRRGFQSGCGKGFDARRVHVIRRAYGLKSRYTRLREQGWLNLREISEKIGLRPSTVRARRAQGTLGVESIILNDMGQHMYAKPDTDGGRNLRTPATCTLEV
jgi:DNA invertase Pin-like site-specific DNA recombinase